MGVLFSYAYDADSVHISNRLAVLMFSTVENDAFINHNTHIRCLYNEWNDLVVNFSYANPTDLMLSEIINHFADGACFTVGHVMCICAFVSDVLKLNKDKKAESLTTARSVSCKMVQKNKTVCKMYLDIVESGWKF